MTMFSRYLALTRLSVLGLLCFVLGALSVAYAADAPQLLSPADAAVITDPGLTFTWTTSAGAARYKLVVKHPDSGYKYKVKLSAASCVDGVCSVSPDDAAWVLKHARTYTWKVVAIGDFGAEQRRLKSAKRSFTTAFPVPGPFALTAPAADSTLDLGSAPTFTWQLSAQAAEYKLIVKAPDRSKVYAAWLDAAEICAAQCSVSPAFTLDQLGGYVWKVKARNAYGKAKADKLRFVSGGVFWATDHESGDMSDWYDGDAVYPRGGIFNTPGNNPAKAEALASTDVAHSGQYSARMTIRGAAGKTRGVRLMRWGNMGWDQGDSLSLPTEAYYSAWFYFPQAYQPAVWWNIFQFKSHDADEVSQPVWVLNVDQNAQGEMWFYLYSNYNPPHSYHVPLTAVTIPVGQWVHVEAFYAQAEDNSGRITVWQDGTLIYDVPNVVTALSDVVVWGIGNYTDDITPADVTIYTDDAVIATQRISGP